jgi:hypothetical protein
MLVHESTYCHQGPPRNGWIVLVRYMHLSRSRGIPILAMLFLSRTVERTPTPLSRYNMQQSEDRAVRKLVRKNCNTFTPTEEASTGSTSASVFLLPPSARRRPSRLKCSKGKSRRLLLPFATPNMVAFRVEALAYPGVVSLVSFLAYTSQWLFYHIQPGPLRKGETYVFNALVLALLVCYTRTCYTDPGRIPSDWHENIQTKDACARVAAEASSRQRYCRKCEMPKPPRAHHCKICKR